MPCSDVFPHHLGACVFVLNNHTRQVEACYRGEQSLLHRDSVCVRHRLGGTYVTITTDKLRPSHFHVLQLHLLREREEMGGAPYSLGWISERQYFRASDVRGRICCCSLTFFCGWVLGNIRRWLEKTNVMGIIWLFSYPSCAHLHPGHCIPQKSPSQMVLPFSLCQMRPITDNYEVLLYQQHSPLAPWWACGCVSCHFFYHCIRWNHSSAYCTSIIKYLSRMSQVL